MKTRLGSPGFSLVEVLVAMLVLAILLVPLVTLVQSQSGMGEVMRDRSIATTLAQGTIERLMSSVTPMSLLEDRVEVVLVAGKPWVVETDVIDGKEADEPVAGTDPLEIHVRVRKESGSEPLVELIALQEDF